MHIRSDISIPHYKPGDKVCGAVRTPFGQEVITGIVISAVYNDNDRQIQSPNRTIVNIKKGWIYLLNQKNPDGVPYAFPEFSLKMSHEKATKSFDEILKNLGG